MKGSGGDHIEVSLWTGRGHERTGARGRVAMTEMGSHSLYLSGQCDHHDDCRADGCQHCGHGSKQWDLEPSAALSHWRGDKVQMGVESQKRRASITQGSLRVRAPR